MFVISENIMKCPVFQKYMIILMAIPCHTDISVILTLTLIS